MLVEGPTHDAPLPTGAGSSQVRFLVLVPSVPQVAEHDSHELHEPQLPSTIRRCSKLRLN